MRGIEHGLFGIAAIALMPLHAIARNRNDLAPAEFQHAVAAEIGPIEIAIRPDQHAIRLVDLGGLDGLAIARKSLDTNAGYGPDTPGGGARRQGHESGTGCQNGATCRSDV